LANPQQQKQSTILLNLLILSYLHGIDNFGTAGLWHIIFLGPAQKQRENRRLGSALAGLFSDVEQQSGRASVLAVGRFS
jgi:hypothetical protein